MLAMNWITPRQQGGLLSSACSVEGDYRYLVWRQFYEKAKLETRRDGNEYQLQSDKSSVCVFCSCLPFLFVKALVLRRARFALEQGVLQMRTSWRVRRPLSAILRVFNGVFIQRSHPLSRDRLM